MALAKYQGNFLQYADSEFDFHANSTRSYSDIHRINLNVGCDVGVFPTDGNLVIVEIDSEGDDVTVYEQDNCLVITHSSPNGGVIFNGNNVVTVTGGQNVVMTNGRVFINGREITSESQPATTKKVPKIRIFAPVGLDLEADLCGLSTFASKILFNRVRVKVSGQSTVGLAARSLKLKVSGQGENFCVIKGGFLEVKLSGQGSVRVKGEYSSADVSVSGMGRIQTDGDCLGDYDASVSGMGSISHAGTVKGRVYKSKSGMGNISISNEQS